MWSTKLELLGVLTYEAWSQSVLRRVCVDGAVSGALGGDSL